VWLEAATLNNQLQFEEKATWRFLGITT
jgi:hypothetical protein